ncbi:obscurin-like [Discoglossus pictus]
MVRAIDLVVKFGYREDLPLSELENSIRASLERADREIRLVLKKLVDSGGSGLAESLQEASSNVKSASARYSEAAPSSPDMYRDADTQTPDPTRDAETQYTAQQESTEASPSPADLQTQTESGVQEHIIPIRLEMDAAGWYHRRSGTQEIWDVHSQVYIETTERTCVHLRDDKATSPPYMQVTIEDVHTNCGDTARFDAVIEGSPPLTITWYKNNTLLKENDRIHIAKEDRRYSLLIHNTNHEDGGVYTCIARNKGGEVSCKAELVMHEEKKEQVPKKIPKRRKLKSFFEVKEEIGRGSFGFLKRVVHKGNGATCAAKFIPLRSRTRQQAYRERDILSEITHDKVTLLLDAFETKKTLVLILEICCGEELLDRLFRKKTVTEKGVKHYVRQLVEAVGFLHEKNILHLDIKPSNILMVHADREDIKLCDFGFAQKLSTSEPQYSKYGAPEFVPPEVVSLSPVSKASDIWPLGVISYLCLVCASPFAGQNDRETLLNVQEGKISWQSSGFVHLSEEAKDFMKRTIQISPEARPTAVECAQHKWFQESSSLQDSVTINTKSLKFLVARSRWQRSLMCYKSILVMRSIPELLQGKLESTSLGVPRHLVECSSSSSSSGSSSDNESDSSPTAKDCNPSLEMHLNIFKMSDKDRLQPQCTTEKAIHTEDIRPEVKIESKEITLLTTELRDKANQGKEISAIVGLSENKILLEDAEEKLVHSVETSPGKPPLFKAATIEVGDLSPKKSKPGCLLRGSSADSALPLEKGVCVPRQSIINSTFYNQPCEGASMAAREGSVKEKEFIKHRERARRSLMKAGYSQKVLSGLREPLLEQFAMEEGMIGHRNQDGQPFSLRKSVSFDTAKDSLKSSFRVSSRSRSLDDYRSRALSVYKTPLVEEADQDTTSELPVEVDKSDTKIKRNSREHSVEKHHKDIVTGLKKKGVESDKPDEVNQLHVPSLKSSTQRPLSTVSTDSESTIIAVLHQQPLRLTGSFEGRPASAPVGDDESTVIAFVQQNRLSDSEVSIQPLSLKCGSDSLDVLHLSQPNVSTTQHDGHSTELAGKVKFTVKNTTDANDFLVSQSPSETLSRPVSSNNCEEKRDNNNVFTEVSTEKPIHAVQYSDNNTHIAVIHQTHSSLSPLLKENIINIEHGVVCSTQPSALAPVQGGEKTPSDSFAAHPTSVSPLRPLSATQKYSEDSIKRSPHHCLVVDENNKIEYPPSTSLQHEIKSALPTHQCELTFQDVDSQGVSKDLRSSVYSHEQCAALEDLVGEMIYLSKEMNVLAGEQEQISNKDHPFPLVYSAPKPEEEKRSERYLVGNDQAKETEGLAKKPSPLAQVMKESKATSISQCSFYDSLSQAQASPLPHEQFEEFTIESCSSSKTFISHSDSSGTGRRSDNFSDFEEAGRHSEVSLVEIKELHYDSTATSSDNQKLGAVSLEPPHFNLFDLYDIKVFPQETKESENIEGILDHIDVTKESLNIVEEQQPATLDRLHLSALTSQISSHEKTMEIPEVLQAVKHETFDLSTSLPPSDPQKAAIKGRKSSSRKRIKLFKPHGKSEVAGKSSDQSLKQKVKASVANISRIIKGKQGNGQERKEGPEEIKMDIPEHESTVRASGQVKKKSGLSSFKLSSLTAKDRAPAFVEELTDQTIVVGHSVTLSCRTAQPIPDVEWFKDGVSIHSSERVLISSTLKNYQLLTILVVTAQDLGIYACVATNSLGSASTCCIIKKAEIPCCPTSPEIAQVYKDGALIVWKPVECSTPVTFSLQYRQEGEEWRTLALDIADCCYSTHNLCEGVVYSFRITCTSKAGMGPYSHPSANVRIGRPSPGGINLTEDLHTTTLERDQTRTLQMEIKRGRFSVVRQCQEKSSRRILAAKIIPYKEENKEATIMEYLVLKKLHHTNIVQLHGAYQSPQHLVLILEMCEGQELLQCLCAGQSYSELEVRDYLWQMLSAVEFLHDKQILHLDLRSENTIVTEHKLLKILDFGNAQFYSPDKAITSERYLDFVETMAPELLEAQGAVPPTDVWAVGVTAFIMMSAEYPFSTDSVSDLEKGIKKGLIKFTRCHAGLSGGAVSFLQSTLWANPWGRPSASDCLKLPWLQEAGLAILKQPPVCFPSAKLKSFLQDRRRELLTKQQGYKLV